MDAFRKFLEVLMEQRGGNKIEAIRTGQIAAQAVMDLLYEEYTREELALLDSPPITALLSYFPLNEDWNSTVVLLVDMMESFEELIKEQEASTT